MKHDKVIWLSSATKHTFAWWSHTKCKAVQPRIFKPAKALSFGESQAKTYLILCPYLMERPWISHTHWGRSAHRTPELCSGLAHKTARLISLVPSRWPYLSLSQTEDQNLSESVPLHEGSALAQFEYRIHAVGAVRIGLIHCIVVSPTHDCKAEQPCTFKMAPPLPFGNRRLRGSGNDRFNCIKCLGKI